MFPHLPAGTVHGPPAAGEAPPRPAVSSLDGPLQVNTRHDIAVQPSLGRCMGLCRPAPPCPCDPGPRVRVQVARPPPQGTQVGGLPEQGIPPGRCPGTRVLPALSRVLASRRNTFLEGPRGRAELGAPEGEGGPPSLTPRGRRGVAEEGAPVAVVPGGGHGPGHGAGDLGAAGGLGRRSPRSPKQPPPVRRPQTAVTVTEASRPLREQVVARAWSQRGARRAFPVLRAGKRL